MAGVVAAAEGVGARLVVLGNIYGYGKEAPSSFDFRLASGSDKRQGGLVRTAMWEQALGSAVPV